MEEIIFPQIFFKKKSSQFVSKNEKQKIADIAKIMNDNPTFVIQIDGYENSSENLVEKIGLSRAKKVYDLLIEKGIAKNRMKIVSYTENEAFWVVSFRLLRKDYIPKQK